MGQRLVIGYDTESVDGFNLSAGGGRASTPFSVSSNKDIDTLSAYMSAASSLTGVSLGLYKEAGTSIWTKVVESSGAIGFSGLGWLVRPVTKTTLVPGEVYVLIVTANDTHSVRRLDISPSTVVKYDSSGVAYPLATNIVRFSSTDTKDMIMFASIQTSPPTVSTQAVSSIASNSAIFNATITSTGEINPTVRGFYYKEGSSGDPTAADSVISSSGSFSAGAYTETPTGLTRDTDYRVAAFATNSEGTTIGATVGFTTLKAAPTVSGSIASRIFSSSGDFSSSVSDDGGATVTERGFVYAKTPTPTTGDTKEIISGEVSDMSATIESLDSDTTYYVRGYAINSVGTAYGAETSFKTHKEFIPSVIIGG